MHVICVQICLLIWSDCFINIWTMWSLGFLRTVLSTFETMWSLGFLRMLLRGFLFIFLFQSDVCTDGNFVTFCSLSLYSVLWKICWRSMLVQQLRMLISFYIMYFYIIEFLDSQVFLSNTYNFTSREVV